MMSDDVYPKAMLARWSEPTSMAERVSGAARPTAERLIKAWLEAKSDDTVKNYMLDLAAFARFLGAADTRAAIEQLFRMSRGEVNVLALEWRGAMVRDGSAPSSVNRRVAALTSFTKLAWTVGAMDGYVHVPRLKVELYRETAGPGADVVKTAIAATHTGGAKAVRDELILRLLFERGLRAKEVRGLDVADVDLTYARVSILGKARRQKEWVSLAPTTVTSLRAWLRVRGDVPGPLIVRVRRGDRVGTTRMTRMGIYGVVCLAGKRVGKRMRPHGLRHSAITQALDAGLDVRTVQRFSRHKNLQTLMVYDDNRKDLGLEVAKVISIETARDPVDSADAYARGWSLAQWLQHCGRTQRARRPTSSRGTRG